MSCVWAAVLAAVDAAQPDPARPRRTLPMPGVLAPKTVWDNSDRRSALWGGISTWTVDAGGRVLVDRLITTYRENADGIADSSYREVTTLRTLARLRRRWHQRISGKYPRHKLADDGVDYPPGQAIVQPKTIRAEAIAEHRLWEQDGLVQAPEAFAENLIVERMATDPNRLDVRMRVKLVGKFLTLATLMEFEH
jgi:phage tail sheath gpL-like